MRKKLIAIIVLVLVLGIALPAFAISFNSGTGNGDGVTYNPSGIISCNEGQTWFIRSYTFDFGFFDSTGTTTFKFRDGAGVIQTLVRTGEHDGVVRIASSQRRLMDWGSVTYNGLSSVGSAQVTFYCA